MAVLGDVAFDRAALRRLLLGGVDIYQRQLGVCRVGESEINAEMVASGSAWEFRKYSTDYVALEDKASGEHLGIWQDFT
ncbi:thermonuclease family protein, partial [Rhizobium johnstonii]|uniref:thermonuclease family protein n=1 Tax=Rhizobium johnstonii TaxID=3019933 RepID=UPI003F9D312E